jgi:hypothetical protein
MNFKKLKSIGKQWATPQAPTSFSSLLGQHMSEGQMQKMDVGAYDSGDGQRFEVFLQVLVQPSGHIGIRRKRFEGGQYWRGGQGGQQQGIGEL